MYPMPLEAVLYFDLFLILPLLVMAWQDFLDRSVSWIIFLLVWLVLVSRAIHSDALGEVLSAGGINLLLVIIQWGLLWVYYQVRSNRLGTILPIGAGDLAFWAVVCFGFTLVPFILFFTGSLLFSLLGHSFIRVLPTKWYASSVPLAGWQALCWVMILVLNHSIPALSSERWEDIFWGALANEH